MEVRTSFRHQNGNPDVISTPEWKSGRHFGNPDENPDENPDAKILKNKGFCKSGWKSGRRFEPKMEIRTSFWKSGWKSGRKSRRKSGRKSGGAPQRKRNCHYSDDAVDCLLTARPRFSRLLEPFRSHLTRGARYNTATTQHRQLSKRSKSTCAYTKYITAIRAYKDSKRARVW